MVIPLEHLDERRGHAAEEIDAEEGEGHRRECDDRERYPVRCTLVVQEVAI
jgi:hypothetical protein